MDIEPEFKHLTEMCFKIDHILHAYGFVVEHDLLRTSIKKVIKESYSLQVEK